MTEEQFQASEYKCAPENHEDWKLIYRHQGDGFNFFYCLHCNWTKPDLASPVFKQLLEEKDARIHELEKALKSIADNTCCDKCQEAASWAKAALSPVEFIEYFLGQERVAGKTEGESK